MKKTLTALACALTLVLSAGTASALTIGAGDPNYLGSVDPGAPANASDEVYYINFLIDMAPGTTDSENPLPNPPNTVYNYSRVGSTLDCGACPTATTTGASNGNAPSGTVDVTGWTYLLAKYGTVSHVWLVSNLTGNQSVPLNAGNGQSHYSLYNPGTVTVPDGGATLGLLGFVMLGVGYLRSRMN